MPETDPVLDASLLVIFTSHVLVICISVIGYCLDITVSPARAPEAHLCSEGASASGVTSGTTAGGDLEFPAFCRGVLQLRTPRRVPPASKKGAKV